MSPGVRTPAEKAEADALEFARLAGGAGVVFVGEDRGYVPDSPRLRNGYPNAGAEEGP